MPGHLPDGEGAGGLNGYSTAQFGKCHEVPVWQTSPAGPFDAWPTGGDAADADHFLTAEERLKVAMACQ